MKIYAYTEDIKLIEMSFFNDLIAIKVIDTVIKIKMINPSVYVILKLPYIRDFLIDNLLNVIEDASKDLIDELYLAPGSSSDKEVSLHMGFLKRNPKLKKCFFHESFEQRDFRYLKYIAAILLEN
jgi:hypothetical protein